ncbi:unnamed protein product [Oikopleura dioica]|uniref:Uncharacterized protein n=1 Tax=Oikopleura dioica TaxID=34765 RepID=E4Y6D1_OIKDI|nr:unnamed protein product [Oikopleura dioica]
MNQGFNYPGRSSTKFGSEFLSTKIIKKQLICCNIYSLKINSGKSRGNTARKNRLDYRLYRHEELSSLFSIYIKIQKKQRIFLFLKINDHEPETGDFQRPVLLHSKL